MAQVLRRLDPGQPKKTPELLVGIDTGDDAAVWRLDDERALVATVDFITPLVDDARTWGCIAAANAVSDVYAMGGRPLFALNVVGWPAELPVGLLSEVLEGAAALARQAGFVIVGGHTVDDPEPKFGLAVIGEVRSDRILTNASLRPGDALILTKPLGIGVVSTAVKRGRLRSDDPLHMAAVASMVRLNAEAARVAIEAGATAATDVTGFGLLGHLRKMAEASQVDVAVRVSAVPLLDGVRELAAEGLVPGGTRRNLAWAGQRLSPHSVDEISLALLADAQTSGGLLFGIPEDAAEAALGELRSTGHQAALIGIATAGRGFTRLH